MDDNNNDFEFKFPMLTLCIAKRGSGKSFLTKYLVHNWIDNGDIDDVFVFTQTNEVNNEYDWVNKKRIFDRFDEKSVEKIMEAQKNQIIKKKKVKNLLVIMDDVIGSLEVHSPIMRRIITQGRHFKISLILNIQISKKEVSPEFRQNSDYILCGYNNRSVFKNLYDELEFEGSLKDFTHFMHKNTIDYNFVLYINKVMDSYEINKRYRIIKAVESDDLDKFKIK